MCSMSSSLSSQDLKELEKRCGEPAAQEMEGSAKAKAKSKAKAKGGHPKVKAKAKAKAVVKKAAKAKAKAKSKGGGRAKKEKKQEVSKNEEGEEDEQMEEHAEEEFPEEDELAEEDELIPMKRPAAKVTRERKPVVPLPAAEEAHLPKTKTTGVEEDGKGVDVFEVPSIPSKRMRKADTVDESQVSGWYLGSFNSACVYPYFYLYV